MLSLLVAAASFTASPLALAPAPAPAVRAAVPAMRLDGRAAAVFTGLAPLAAHAGAKTDFADAINGAAGFDVAQYAPALGCLVLIQQAYVVFSNDAKRREDGGAAYGSTDTVAGIEAPPADDKPQA